MSRSRSQRTIKLVLATSSLTFAAVLATALHLQWGAVSSWTTSAVNWAWLTSALSLLLGLMFVQSIGTDKQTAAIWRLDWFLPAIRRLAARSNPSSTPGGRALRKLGVGLQSNWQTKQRGLTRNLLRRMGVSWIASPIRRLTQASCFMLFCWLFFYVCWPYHAAPAPPRVVGHLTFASFAQTSGVIEFLVDDGEFESPAQRTIFLAPYRLAITAGREMAALGQFQIVESTKDRLSLKPLDSLSAEMLDVVTGVSDLRHFEATDRDPFAWPDHYARSLTAKELVPAETFLIIDPLVSLSTAIASRSWVWSLGSAAGILVACVMIPRGFCGYICPLGTTIDLFDWAFARRTKRFRVSGDGWWVHVKYYLLAGILVAACFGVLISGFFSAIPVLTRGMLFIVDPIVNGQLRGWHRVPSIDAAQIVSIVLFVGVLCLGFFRERFWCKYVCPSGAVFSLSNLFRATERKVESSCIHCNKCVEVCPFDAIKPDFTTRETDCTLCQTCGGVCPTHAIKFVERWNRVELKIENDPPTEETRLGRRGFISLAAGSAAAIIGGSTAAIGTRLLGGNRTSGRSVQASIDDAHSFLPVRPPGSVPEQEFLEMCIRCGECFKACPNNVLQPEGFQQGLEGLWTPMVNADWAGCESSCNACGQVCPTGAIRPLPLEEKRFARMGLAIVNSSTCLPFAEKEACDLCVQECISAGYDAIEYTQVGVELDQDHQPIEGTGFAAPVVLADKCVGCGLCQTRCHAINVRDRQVLTQSAIIVAAGEGMEDRMTSGSYRDLRPPADPKSRPPQTPAASQPQPPTIEPENPFGIDGEPNPVVPADVDESPF